MKIDKSDWIIVENTHEPIIDQYTFDRVQELMKLRTKSTLKTGNVYLFSGLLRCADCKRAMERVVVNKKNGKVYVNYRCHTYTAYSHDACTKAHHCRIRDLHSGSANDSEAYAGANGF